MLTEIVNVKQYEAGKHRRWFHNDFFDLYVWQQSAKDDSAPLGFQLCYAKDGAQRALRYSPEHGYHHEGVDQPEDKPGRAMSALFVADGAFQVTEIADRFSRDAINLPPLLHTFVLSRLQAYVPSPQIEITTE